MTPKQLKEIEEAVPCHNNKADVEMWQNAIAEARRQLWKVEGRVAALKAAIHIFEQNIKNGEPWPR